MKDLNQADDCNSKSSIKATLVEIIQVERTSTKEDTVPEISLSFEHVYFKYLGGISDVKWGIGHMSLL